jgi:hypothetical protein
VVLTTPLRARTRIAWAGGKGATRPGIVTMATCGRGCGRSQRFANDQSLTIVTRPDPVWSKSVIERGRLMWPPK